MRNRGIRQMRNVAIRAAAVAVAVWCGVGSGAAKAADFAVPGQPVAPQYYGQQEYIEPPLQPEYVLPPPAPIYSYPAPVYRYGYAPPVAVVPSPYYRPYRYGYGYGYGYGYRSGYRHGYVARGHGPYGGGRYRYHGRYR
jgi:hypothetical protein